MHRIAISIQQMGASWNEFFAAPIPLRRPDMPKTVDQLNADIARLTKSRDAEQDATKKQEMQRELDAAEAECKTLAAKP
jgi:hypothetical protein